MKEAGSFNSMYMRKAGCRKLSGAIFEREGSKRQLLCTVAYSLKSFTTFVIAATRNNIIIPITPSAVTR